VSRQKTGREGGRKGVPGESYQSYRDVLIDLLIFGYEESRFTALVDYHIYKDLLKSWVY
jgi:hypothetical protein